MGVESKQRTACRTILRADRCAARAGGARLGRQCNNRQGSLVSGSSPAHCGTMAYLLGLETATTSSSSMLMDRSRAQGNLITHLVSGSRDVFRAGPP